MTVEEIDEDIESMASASQEHELYEITVSRWKDDEKTDIDILYSSIVKAQSEQELKKYIEDFARKVVQGGKWQWAGCIYEEKDGRRCIIYEKFSEMSCIALELLNFQRNRNMPNNPEMT